MADTVTKTAVSEWLDGYVKAWKTYDKEAIGALFSEDVVYYDAPYQEPVKGRAALVASWLEQPDKAGTYDAHYEPVLIEGDRVVTNGRSQYFEQDGKTLKKEYDNIFLLQFDAQGQCKEYREWYMERPKK
ncbi:MAG: nuclear transport factor 2 family protein [Ktedonobacteraceae bacterium]|nr:nuclear transport factor 2 family protein [Ktedonobacteraceae bacterium]